MVGWGGCDYPMSADTAICALKITPVYISLGWCVLFSGIYSKRFLHAYHPEFCDVTINWLSSSQQVCKTQVLSPQGSTAVTKGKKDCFTIPTQQSAIFWIPHMNIDQCLKIKWAHVVFCTCLRLFLGLYLYVVERLLTTTPHTAFLATIPAMLILNWRCECCT